MNREISTTFILPAYNEERSITRALQSLIDQTLDNMAMRIIVVANGCTDQTAQKASDFSKSSKLPIQIIETDLKQKGNAINLGIANAQDRIVMYGDADCVFGELAVAKISRELVDSNQYAAVGGLAIPDFSSSDPESLLYEFQKIIDVERMARGRFLTVGALIGLNQDKITDPFPINVHSEDIWLALYVVKKYGFEAVKVLQDAKVYYQPPLTWSDFLAQQTRYKMSLEQLFDKFPDLREIYSRGKINLTPEMKGAREKEIQRILNELGISQEKRTFLHSIFDKAIEENAQYYLDMFLKSNGDWKPVLTTKLN